MAAIAEVSPNRRDDHRDLSLDKIKCQRLHPVVLALRPAILNDNLVAIEIADCKPRRKPAMRWVKGPADVVLTPSRFRRRVSIGIGVGPRELEVVERSLARRKFPQISIAFRLGAQTSA